MYPIVLQKTNPTSSKNPVCTTNTKSDTQQNDPSEDPLFKWCLDNLLRESGYLEIVMAPFCGGPYYFRKSDSTFWELQEIQKVSANHFTSDSKALSNNNESDGPKTVILCFNKVSTLENCESLQETHNIGLGTFDKNEHYSGNTWDMDDTGGENASKWKPAPPQDPRRVKYNPDAQTKAPFTLAISLKPEILQSCLDKQHKINKTFKKDMRKSRAKTISNIAKKLGLVELKELPIELSRYSQKRKRRYYLQERGGTGPDGDYPTVWFVNHLDPRYRNPVTFWKPESFDELRDVCLVNNLEVPPRRYLTMQRSILYCDA